MGGSSRVHSAPTALALPAQLVAISPAELRVYLDQKIAPSTAARRLAALRALFAWAIREDHCASDPTATVETPRRDRRLLRPIRADADRLAVDRAIVAVPQPFRLALTILRETGMRADEVLALTIGDVVLDTGREALHVRDAKNRSEPYGRAWRGCDTQELARAASYTPRTEERAAPRSALIETHV